MNLINKLNTKTLNQSIANPQGYFFKMYKDNDRNQFYKKMIDENIAGKVVLEVGCGVGLLSVLCAKAEAKHVYALEANKEIYHLAQKVIQENNVEDRVTLINISSYEFNDKEILSNVDIVLHELFSTNFFNESVLNILIDLKKKVSKDVLFLPEKAEVKIVGVKNKNEITPSNIIEGVKLNIWNEVNQFEFLNTPWSGDLEICTKDKDLFKFNFQDKIKASDTTILNSDYFGKCDYLCQYFILSHKGLKLSNLELENTLFANHWGVTLYTSHLKNKALKAVYNLNEFKIITISS